MFYRLVYPEGVLKYSTRSESNGQGIGLTRLLRDEEVLCLHQAHKNLEKGLESFANCSSM